MHKMLSIFNKICLEYSANRKCCGSLPFPRHRGIYENSVAWHAIPWRTENHGPYLLCLFVVWKGAKTALEKLTL